MLKMIKLDTAALEAAYRATRYRVYLPQGQIDLRIDEVSQSLSKWLKAQGTDSFAIVTGFNPESTLQTVEINSENQSRLECTLIEGNYEPYAGENVPDDSSAPLEESCFVADIELEDALALADDFGQSAIVFGRGDGIPHLVWIKQTAE